MYFIIEIDFNKIQELLNNYYSKNKKQKLLKKLHIYPFGHNINPINSFYLIFEHVSDLEIFSRSSFYFNNSYFLIYFGKTFNNFFYFLNKINFEINFKGNIC